MSASAARSCGKISRLQVTEPRIGTVSVVMWSRTHDGSGAMWPPREDGVVEDADGSADRTHQKGGLLHRDVQTEAGRDVEALDRRLVAGDLLDGLAHRLGRPQRVRRHEQRVARLHAELLAHLGVDDRVDGGYLRRVGADSHARCVAAAAELEHAVLGGDAPLQLLHDGELAGGDPVPLLLEVGALDGRVVAVGRGVDRGQVDGAVLDAHLRHRQRLDAAHALDLADPLDDVVGQRGLAEHQDVGAPQRARPRPDPLGGLGRGPRSPVSLASVAVGDGVRRGAADVESSLCSPGAQAARPVVSRTPAAVAATARRAPPLTAPG